MSSLLIHNIGMLATPEGREAHRGAEQGKIRVLENAWIYLENGENLRETIHPKRPDPILRDLGLDRPYYQVFAPKYGFIPNLSILDLLFNEGPDSISYLIKKG